MGKRGLDALLWLGFHLRSGMQMQGTWEVEVGKEILGQRKKLILIALLPILCGIGFEWAFAEAIPSKIPLLGGSRAYIPAHATDVMFYGSILVGLLAGLITGVIGAGGGYILTPALMSFGVKGIMAVGTDQFHLFAKAIMGTVVHRKLGNVNPKLAAWFVLGSFFGVTLGGMVNRSVYQYNPALSDALISGVYVIVLGILGFYSLADWLKLRKMGPEAQGRAEATTHFAKRLQSIPWKPRIRFDEDVVKGGRSLSVYPVILCGSIVGFAAAIMGVGGGFLTFPMFV